MSEGIGSPAVGMNPDTGLCIVIWAAGKKEGERAGVFVFGLMVERSDA